MNRHKLNENINRNRRWQGENKAMIEMNKRNEMIGRNYQLENRREMFNRRMDRQK